MLGYLRSSPSKTTMPTEKSPLTVGGKPTAYFMERAKSINTKAEGTAISESHVDVEEHETLPEGSAPNQFTPRPVASIASVQSGAPPTKAGGLFGGLFGKKSNAVHSLDAFPRKAPVKVDPKVFFANERTFLAWMHVSVILAGASVAIVAFADAQSAAGQLYGVILLPVSISFIVYAMMQFSRRANMIRRKSPGPYVDIVGPTVLTVLIMISIVTQFSIKLYTLM